LVTPLDLQRGAKKVAAHKNIKHVILDPDSTTTEYIMRFLNDTFLGVAGMFSAKPTIQYIQDGKVIETRHSE
jgi:hypothetical protein